MDKIKRHQAKLPPHPVVMFAWKKDSADISDKEPTFHVRYIGHTETFSANGPGCTTTPLQKLWDNAPHERYLRKVAIQLSRNGICVRDADRKEADDPVKFFSIEDISFCAADKALNERLFCWICKHPISGKLEAHAVLCSTKDKAETMASVLSRAFHLAYKDWKTERQREERRKSVTAAGGYPVDASVAMTTAVKSAKSEAKRRQGKSSERSRGGHHPSSARNGEVNSEGHQRRGVIPPD